MPQQIETGDGRPVSRQGRNLQNGEENFETTGMFVFDIFSPFGFEGDILEVLRLKVGTGELAIEIRDLAMANGISDLENMIALEMRITELAGGRSYTYELWM